MHRWEGGFFCTDNVWQRRQRTRDSFKENWKGTEMKSVWDLLVNLITLCSEDVTVTNEVSFIYMCFLVDVHDLADTRTSQ